MFCVEFHTVQKNLLIVFQKKKISKSVSNAYFTSLNLNCVFFNTYSNQRCGAHPSIPQNNWAFLDMYFYLTVEIPVLKSG